MRAKNRRRVVRRSDASDYDRHADTPMIDKDYDADRIVIVDSEESAVGDDLTGIEFYLEQRPPHHGGA